MVMQPHLPARPSPIPAPLPLLPAVSEPLESLHGVRALKDDCRITHAGYSCPRAALPVRAVNGCVAESYRSTVCYRDFDLRIKCTRDGFSVLRSVVMFDRRQLRSCVRLLVLGDFALFAVDGYDAAGATTSRADVVRSIVVPP